VILLYTTFLTLPIAPYTVLILTPFWLRAIVLFAMSTPSTSLSERPPTEPMLSPWPPEHVPSRKRMERPELMARQSSWFVMLAWEMVMSEELPTSKASVLWPPVGPSPAELSIVMFERVRECAVLMLKPWTGMFLMVREVTVEWVREWAEKNCASNQLGYDLCGMGMVYLWLGLATV
jgi:hypothetical protein